MSGVFFLATKNLKTIRDFYLQKVGMQLWLDKGDCIILKHGNMLLGFCEREEVERKGVVSIFLETKEEIDEKYEQFKETAKTAPQIREQYGIYNFFTKDPDGRELEFMHFLEPVEPYLDAVELLLTRRSVRKFKKDDVPDELLAKIFEVCRFSPTTRNCQSYYFVLTRDRVKIEKLASLKEKTADPIRQAPLAVAICVDTEKTTRITDDGHIASYHFMLTAKAYGLGTCWIGGMNRDEAKEILGIPKEHFISTITPLGFPDEIPELHERREASELYKIV